MHSLFRWGAGASMAREFDGQLRSAFRPAGGVDLSAEILDDAVRDGESEAETLAQRLGGEERIEDAVDLGRRNALAVIGNRDGHRVVGGARADADPRLVPAGHGI